ncbi:MAG TPA: methylamine utilization protein [Thermoanaerobaculia bacterium]|nr:methylamine utilization protein [Thermoanaerobaculia bacterium]
MRPILSTIPAVLLSLPIAAATLDVRVDGPGGKTIENAVVYAIPSAPVAVGRKVAIMDQKDRIFIPHVLPVQTGTWVEFPNSDNIRHQVYSVSPTRRFQLPLYIGKPAIPIQFNKAGIVAIGCNIHEQMSAWIVVVDTPYFATTDRGRATLRDLSAGRYTLHLWYPGMRSEPKAQTMTLAAADQATASFTVE